MSGTNMSLAELEALQNKTDTPPPKAPLEGGDGTKTPADLEAERQKQAQEEADRLKQQQQSQKTPEQILAEEAAAAQATADKLALRVAELKGKPAEQLTAEEKAELTAAEAEAEPEDDEDPAAFWEDVDKLSGDPIVIKWEDQKDDAGNPISPDSPQGALIRQKAVEDRAVERYEEYLMQLDPRGYQYLLHRQAGRSDEDFFNQKTTTLPDYEALKESIDLQSAFYTQVLRGTGLSEKQAKMIVDDAVKNKEIAALADKAYKEAEATQTQATKALQDQVTREDQAYQASVTALGKLIDTEITSPGLKIIVPDAKRMTFATFVKSMVSYNAGTKQFELVQPITRETLPRQLESLYLQHVNGNLTDIVRREATTQNTRKLKRQVDKSKETAKGQPENGKTKKTLGEI